MTVNEFMNRRRAETHSAPLPCGGDYVLALSRDENAPPENYLVLRGGASDIKAEIVSDIDNRRYVLSGGSFRRKTAVRKFSAVMNRKENDELQNILCSPEILFGTEQQCIFGYVYFSASDGKGEKGTVTVSVVCDADGEANLPAVMSVDMFGCGGKPSAYVYGGDET